MDDSHEGLNYFRKPDKGTLSCILIYRRLINMVRVYIKVAHVTGADLGGAKEASAPPSKIFYLHVTSTINSMKISFNDV